MGPVGTPPVPKGSSPAGQGRGGLEGSPSRYPPEKHGVGTVNGASRFPGAAWGRAGCPGAHRDLKPENQVAGRHSFLQHGAGVSEV